MVDGSLGRARDAGLARPRLGARLFVALQHLIPQHALSRAVHRLARSRAGPVKNALIRAFVRGYRPRLEEAAEPNPLAYGSFNEFFTRALRPDARPISTGSELVLSPVDGAVSQIGHLDELMLLQAKGRYYRLDALLSPAGAEWARRLAGGAFATLYLAPYDYHRIHMPVAATLKAAWYVPGRLFSVNTVTAAAVTGLFARNERVICAFESDAGMPFAMVLVGALFVGSITTRWHGEVTPCRPRAPRTLPVPREARLEEGAEMGRFNMGSTVILLFPRGALAWRAALGPASRIVVGQPLARLEPPALRDDERAGVR
ncbi:MAG TPA: archaetidylserine decarboxylase [Steroidobacteraceae bacterium]